MFSYFYFVQSNVKFKINKVMAYWQVKVKVQTETDNGRVRNHQELFLANAESATEAETLAHKEFEGESFYDFEVVDCKKTKVIKIL